MPHRCCSDDLVLVDNLGYTSTGQVVNCNCQEVAAAVAISLGADKLILLTSGALATYAYIANHNANFP